MENSIKVFELGQEFDLKHTDFIPLIQKLGFDIKGFSTNLSSEQAEEIRAEVKRYYIEDDLAEKEAAEALRLAQEADLEKKKAIRREFDELNVGKLVGTYFCPIKKRYFILDLDLDPFQMAKHELLQGKGYGSIYNLNHDFNLKIGRKGLLKPAKLADGKKWKDMGEDK